MRPPSGLNGSAGDGGVGSKFNPFFFGARGVELKPSDPLWPPPN